MIKECTKGRSTVTIENIVAEKKCMSCGACSGFCPKSAIRMSYIDEEGLFKPIIDHAHCVECGICLKCCPAIDHWKKDAIIGEYKELLLAHSTNGTVRHWSTSGGVINDFCSKKTL